MIFNKLSEEGLKAEYFHILYNRLANNITKKIFKDSFEGITQLELIHLLRYADIFSNSSDSFARNISYKIVALLFTFFKTDPIYRTFSVAIFSRLGNFPAINYTNYDVELPYMRELEKEVKIIIQKIPGTDKIFTDPQFELFNKLINTDAYSFSGPTSMGKSFLFKRLIYQFLEMGRDGNYCIIVPTRALINQFSIELRKDLKDSLTKKNYRVLSNSSISELTHTENTKYIFVLTPERLISYLSKNENPPFDYLFIDEAHKLAAEKDYRSITLYLSIERTMRAYPNIKIFFAAPNVSNPAFFLEMFNKDIRKKYRTLESPVSQNLFFIDLVQHQVISYSEFGEFIFKPKIIEHSSALDIIYKMAGEESNLIYCSSVPNAI